tara:strand:+ start:1277 stop:1831 length:555 start_codon:yes stop_codon:yes gene_type:complete
MRDLIISIIALLSFTFSYSQNLDSWSLGVGIGFNSNEYEVAEGSLITVNADYLEGRYLYGIDIGVGKAINEESNYTGIVSQFRWAEDVEGLTYSQSMLAGRFGYEVSPKIYLIGTVGGSFFTQYQERFDEYYILGRDGWYFVSTDNSKTEAYLKGSIAYREDNLMFEAGYSNVGLALSISYVFF